jgi:hypothetical protein
MTIEQRSFATSFSTEEGKRLVGYAAVWDTPTTIREAGRTFTEVIRRGAFRKAIDSKGDIIATFNHDPNRLLGRTASGTLSLAEDDHGLRFMLELPDTPTGAEVRALVQRGDLNGASFSFAPRKDGNRWQGSQRELVDLFLFELGPVALPAYKATSLALRSNLDLCKLKLTLAEKI